MTPCGGAPARREKLSALRCIGSRARSEPHSIATSAPASEDSGRALAGARGRRCGVALSSLVVVVGEKRVRRKEPAPRTPV